MAASVGWFAAWSVWAGIASAQPVATDDTMTRAADTDMRMAGDNVQSTEAATEIAPSLVSDLAVLDETLAEHRRLGRTAQALKSAQEIAAQLEEQQAFGPRLFEMLGTIAELQREMGEVTAAEQTLRALVGLIEEKDGVFSPNLVEPLARLAEIQSNSDRREDAITLLRRARHITHRRFGILNMEQIELADQLVDNYFHMGRINEGSRESRFAFRVNVNEYGADSAELVPAINALADWYERIGEFAAARNYYKQSIALIEKDYGENDLRLVTTLSRLARTYKRQAVYRSEGQNALARVISIYESHPEADEIDYAHALTNLADWQMSTLRTREAMESYRRVWNRLTDDGANPERGNLFFNEPKRVRYSPPIPTSSRLLSVAEVYVDVELVVKEDGSVRDISVADSNADWRTQGEVKSAMRGARFRPRLVDGEPVETKITTRWTYVVPESLRRGDVAKKKIEQRSLEEVGAQ